MSRLNELYKLAKAGDMAAEKEMLELLSTRFRLHAEIILGDYDDADDVAQQACITIQQKYKDVNITSSFSSFASGVLKNKIGNYIQKRRSQKKIKDRLENSHNPEPYPIVPDIEGNLKSSGNPGPYPVDPDLERRLLACLKMIRKVNLRYARILNLKFHGYNTDEVCKIIRIKSGNFYGILSHGRAMLKICLETGEV